MFSNIGFPGFDKDHSIDGIRAWDEQRSCFAAFLDNLQAQYLDYWLEDYPELGGETASAGLKAAARFDNGESLEAQLHLFSGSLSKGRLLWDSFSHIAKEAVLQTLGSLLRTIFVERDAPHLSELAALEVASHGAISQRDWFIAHLRYLTPPRQLSPKGIKQLLDYLNQADKLYGGIIEQCEAIWGPGPWTWKRN